MIKPRPLYCPNIILLDSGTDLTFPVPEVKAIIDKLHDNQKVIVVYINHLLDKTDNLQIIVKSNGYAIYQEKNKEGSNYTSQLLAAGPRFVYYIQTEQNRYRNGFVHFYDILAAEYPIICISNNLANQVQSAAIILPSQTSKNKKEEYSKLVLNPESLYTSKEFELHDLVFENTKFKIEEIS